MLFHITFEMSPEQRNSAQQRFRETGGPPPDSITMVGRWHSAGGLLGFLVAETDDATAIGKWMQDWTDLISFDVIPVLNDEQITEVMG
jgi:hypothetical protein